MAYATLVMKNPENGLTKQAPVGFSWTSLFFGFFVPLFRGDAKWALVWLVAFFVLPVLSFIIQAFVYNKLYIQELIEKGYRAEKGTIPLDRIESRSKIPLLKLEDHSA